MRILGLLLSVYLFIGCRNTIADPKDTRKSKSNTSNTDQTDSLKFSSYDNSTYVLSNDTLVQTLSVTIHSKKQIEFDLLSKNIRTNISIKLNGYAILSEHEDSESDVDEDGNGYFVDEYLSSKDCSVSFRLDADEFRRATITAYDCGPQNDPLMPIGSAGILHRVK